MSTTKYTGNAAPPAGITGNPSSLAIGITGGIGSGKTTVANLIERLGHPVYYSDAAAARLVNTDDDIKNALARCFGEDIYDPDGHLRRSRLAAIIFNHPAALAAANAIIHPAVAADFRAWRDSHREPLLFLESALLADNILAADLDAIILVLADLETRVQRVMQRDNITRVQVLERARNQPLAGAIHADFTIRNNPGDMLLEPLLAILDTLQNRWPC
ncbi:MAG: dephospho-CoA kinase [Odoribacteraceae bacterium]|jgi:dephospho-CoA kinase|nr:dephospho-CoA kinase [Odoribacteraceae bacterium]